MMGHGEIGHVDIADLPGKGEECIDHRRNAENIVK